jgi:hypothetical protein
MTREQEKNIPPEEKEELPEQQQWLLTTKPLPGTKLERW